MIESVADVRSKIKLDRWNRPARPADRNRPVLQCIVQTILSVLKSQPPHRGSEATVTPAKADSFAGVVSASALPRAPHR